MNHNLEQSDNGYLCAVCRKLWKTKPRSHCAGVVYFASHSAPENLKTERQLRKMRLKPGSTSHDAVVGFMETKQYDISKAIPLSDEEIARDRAIARAKRYEICDRCGDEFAKAKLTAFEGFFQNGHFCAGCFPIIVREDGESEEKFDKEREEEFQNMRASSRDGAIVAARSWLNLGDKAVILDTETTGLEYKDQIIQIAVLGLDGQVLLDASVRPTVAIQEEAFAVHGVSVDDLSQSPTFDLIFPALQRILNGKTVVTYNAEFDSRMIAQSSIFYSLPKIEAVFECAMEAYARFVGEWNAYHGSFRWQKLDGGDHTALGDCKATLALIQKMANEKMSTELKTDNEHEAGAIS